MDASVKAVSAEAGECRSATAKRTPGKQNWVCAFGVPRVIESDEPERRGAASTADGPRPTTETDARAGGANGFPTVAVRRHRPCAGWTWPRFASVVTGQQLASVAHTTNLGEADGAAARAARRCSDSASVESQ